MRDLATAPRSVAVEPSRGLVFWSQWATGDTRGRGAISSSWGDGSQATTLVSGLQWPGGLALAPDHAWLYWVDSRAGTVERVSYRGRGGARQLLTPTSHTPYGLTLTLDTNTGMGCNFTRKRCLQAPSLFFSSIVKADANLC